MLHFKWSQGLDLQWQFLFVFGMSLLRLSPLAKALINSLRKGNLYAMESLLNRSVGMPKQQNEIQIEEKKIDVTLSL